MYNEDDYLPRVDAINIVTITIIDGSTLGARSIQLYGENGEVMTKTNFTGILKIKGSKRKVDTFFNNLTEKIEDLIDRDVMTLLVVEHPSNVAPGFITPYQHIISSFMNQEDVIVVSVTSNVKSDGIKVSHKKEEANKKYLSIAIDYCQDDKCSEILKENVELAETVCVEKYITYKFIEIH